MICEYFFQGNSTPISYSDLVLSEKFHIRKITVTHQFSGEKIFDIFYPLKRKNV